MTTANDTVVFGSGRNLETVQCDKIYNKGLNSSKNFRPDV